MTDPVDQEIEAIRNVLASLGPLSAKARMSVLEYVAKRLDLEGFSRSSEQRDILPKLVQSEKVESPARKESAVHIKTLKEEKKPRSANEMAALVAYYLSSVAPPEQRKSTVNQKDIETYFKIAGFRLPTQTRVTLANAKTAGYFDGAGSGEYKLNAVGHNLVVHSMPRGSGTAVGPKKKVHAKNRTKS
jgi:hypothetical protein